MTSSRAVVILGATKGMGRSLARQLVAKGDRVCLLGRNLEELKHSVADLRIRSDREDAASWVECDLAEPGRFEAALSEAQDLLGGLDIVIVTAASFASQEQLEQDSALTQQLLQTNFVNTILFCEAARKQLLANKGGTLCVFSSVAGDRGRKPVILYGATKAGISAYLEGLDHKYHSAGLRVVCVKPGFVRTGMTAGLKVPPFAGDPEPVASSVLVAIDNGKPLVYAPWIWKWIMFIIRRLPRFVMRRIGF